ncbi:MAG: hypothetical protein LPH21_08905 [Shewanella sp.]|nr:hypothetical protein [Shewanella sp.]MCF1431311.1 hypothetical protein [Shewanella sp.]MCF1457664.1 hypothetical protein [Shewanella sp.]
MMKQIILSGLAGVLVGFSATWLTLGGERLPEAPLASVEQAELERLRRENEMQQLENDLLLKMVKAGLKGDIASHMETYRQLPGRQRADTPAPERTSDAKSEATGAGSHIDPTAFIARIQRADIALQKQALREGWAYDTQLAQARRELWAEAKGTLNESEYLKGLHAAGIPNVLYFGTAKSAQESALGLHYGDVLTHIAGVRIFNRDDLRLQLENSGETPTLELTFSRRGQTINVQVADLNNTIELHGDSLAPDKLATLGQ